MNANAIRILRVVHETGRRKRSVLVGLAGGDAALVEGMIKHGMLKKHGSKRGTQYGYGTLARLPKSEAARIREALRKPPVRAQGG